MEDGLESGYQPPGQGKTGLQWVDRQGEQGTNSLETRGQGHPDLVTEGMWGHGEPRVQDDSTTSDGAVYQAGKTATPRLVKRRNSFSLKSSLELGPCG